ncbi:MAG: CRISPR-associated protein Cas5 [Firmicutes bacterium]|nr:CRISPR-associated protein Cas5 [Bacillota bacterium]
MKLLVFDLKAELGHFRRPDTTGTHATYPFITRTVLQGLIASILGLDRLTGENWAGVGLLHPVQTSAQEMSMLGKGWLGEAASTFNRPTSIELVVRPGYRVYYTGDHLEKLYDMLRKGQSHYHTYMGSAYCLTFPRFVHYLEAEELNPEPGNELKCKTVIPSHAIENLIPTDGSQYGRVGGMHYEYLGNRRFRGTVNIIYETSGKPIVFEAKGSSLQQKPFRFCSIDEQEVVCLW